MRFLLVTSVRNEGSSIWEWVAHHLLVGFTDIVVFQNDSDDGTRETLSVLQDLGVIKFFHNGYANGAETRDWQGRAYRRIGRQDVYQKADYVMALDGDEYLCIKTPEQTIQSLIPLAPDFDEMRINWKIFGSSGLKDISGKLVSERFTLGQPDKLVATKPEAFKTLFRPQKFKRPGIHRPKVPLADALTETNGSGMKQGTFPSYNWFSTDPECRKYAQVNHYIIRDAQTFLLKVFKGRPGFPPMDVSYEYWDKFNVNEDSDELLKSRSPALIEKMQELDDASDGKLYRLRVKALQKQIALFEKTQVNPEYRKLYNHACTQKGE